MQCCVFTLAAEKSILPFPLHKPRLLSVFSRQHLIRGGFTKLYHGKGGETPQPTDQADLWNCCRVHLETLVGFVRCCEGLPRHVTEVGGCLVYSAVQISRRKWGCCLFLLCLWCSLREERVNSLYEMCVMGFEGHCDQDMLGEKGGPVTRMTFPKSWGSWLGWVQHACPSCQVSTIIVVVWH